MIRHRSPARFGRLAILQDLAALERRRALENACALTDRRTTEAGELAQALSTAEIALEQVYAEDRLCLDRLRLAAWIVGDNERALTRGTTALEEAKSDEHEAGSEWMAARHRTEWFADQARLSHKKEADRLDEAAESEARSLRLAMRESLA